MVSALGRGPSPVTAAPEHPILTPGGAPVSVLIDFDGTISLEDVGDVLLGRLVAHVGEQRQPARRQQLGDPLD